MARLYLVASDETLEAVTGARTGTAAALRAVVDAYRRTTETGLRTGSPEREAAAAVRTAEIDTLITSDPEANLLHSLMYGAGLDCLQAITAITEAGLDVASGSTDDRELMITILNVQRNHTTSFDDVRNVRDYNLVISRACDAVMRGEITALVWA